MQRPARAWRCSTPRRCGGMAAAGRRGRGCAAAPALARPRVQRRLHEGHRDPRGRSLPLRLRRQPRVPAHHGRGRRGRADVQPGRLEGGLRPPEQPVRRRHGDAARGGVDHRRSRPHPERQAGLGVRGGDLRPRRTARVLVEPGFVAARVSPHRRYARLNLRHAGRHQLRPPRRDVALPAGGRSQPHGEAGGRAGRRRRPGRDLLDRHVQVRRRGLPDRPRRVEPRRPAGLRGAEPHADVARPQCRRLP